MRSLLHPVPAGRVHTLAYTETCLFFTRYVFVCGRRSMSTTAVLPRRARRCPDCEAYS